MTVMLYKEGGDTLVWGRKLKTKVVAAHEVEDHLEDGWHVHPHDVPATFLDGQAAGDDVIDKGKISDGFHTFNELYAHRVRLFSTLMNAYPKLSWWSHKQSDGEDYEGWILAGIETPAGQITYHLPESEIEFLPVGTELDIAKDWDGHEAADVLERLISMRPLPTAPEVIETAKKSTKAVANADANQG